MNMKKILIIGLFPFLLIACEQERESVTVKYFVTNSNSGFKVKYQSQDGEIVIKDIITQSKQDKWVVSFKAQEGDIVYLSVHDTEAASFPKAMIIVNNKIFKQASRTNDTIMPVVVSGTIPY